MARSVIPRMIIVGFATAVCGIVALQVIAAAGEAGFLAQLRGRPPREAVVEAELRVLSLDPGSGTSLCRGGAIVFEVTANKPIVDVATLLDDCLDATTVELFSGAEVMTCATAREDRNRVPFVCRRASVAEDSPLIPVTFSVRMAANCTRRGLRTNSVVTVLSGFSADQPQLTTVQTEEVEITMTDCDDAPASSSRAASSVPPSSPSSSSIAASSVGASSVAPPASSVPRSSSTPSSSSAAPSSTPASSVSSARSLTLSVEGVCGDGTVDEGEECDDGDEEDGDGCSRSCLAERGECGDGVIQKFLGEQCDGPVPNSGTTAVPYGCGSDCRYRSPTCGNGAVDLGEECDDAARNAASPNASCRPNCSLSRCGDGVVDPPAEQCDDGYRLPGDGCSASCRLEPGAVLPSSSSSSAPAVVVQASSNPPVVGGSSSRPQYATSPITIASSKSSASVAGAVTGRSGAPPVPPTQIPLAQSGPVALAVMAFGAAGGYAWMRRKR